MAKLTGLHPHPTGRGFTLVELLLTVVLLMLLASAAVISFSTLLSGSELEEGAAQMEGLMRFARAHAANSGKKVQLVFEEQTEDGMIVPLGNVRVLCEADPLGLPGEMSELSDAAMMVQSVSSLVQVEDVRSLGEETELMEQEQTSFAPITFYPDGSSDSAEVVLSSRSPEELRRVFIRVTGITGAIRRGWVVTEEEVLLEEELFP
ncbi:MAG TPA: GspH/FimT family pseudopilin [Verrucomicrobiae bacterium]|nr:GspH/FimT family pseudopilin [Verrucomicrobiae bacterium]